MAVVGAALRRERKRQEGLRGNLILGALAIFAFIWMLPVLWALVSSFRTEAALQRQLASLMPYPFHARELDLHPGQQPAVEMGGE